MTAPRLRRIDRGTWHEYRLDGETRLVGVTTLLGDGMPKPALVQWSADMAASYAVEHWDELRALPLAKAIDRIRYAHRDRTRTAQVRGTTIHEYGEAIAHGTEVEVADELRGPAEAYARFLDAWDIHPIATETPIANLTHMYAGTGDLMATIGARDNARAWIDLKTGTGVFDEVALQLAAYRYGEIWQPDGPESEGVLPPVDLVYVAHVLPDDVRMIPVVAGPEEFREFLYVAQTARWIRSLRRDRDGRSERRVVLDAVNPQDREEIPA